MSALSPKIPLPEVARRWGWTQDKLRRLVAEKNPAKRIPAVRIGRQLYFEEAALEAWLAARRTVTAASEGRRRPRSRAEECARLGIPEDHEFSEAR